MVELVVLCVGECARKTADHSKWNPATARAVLSPSNGSQHGTWRSPGGTSAAVYGAYRTGWLPTTNRPHAAVTSPLRHGAAADDVDSNGSSTPLQSSGSSSKPTALSSVVLGGAEDSASVGDHGRRRRADCVVLNGCSHPAASTVISPSSRLHPAQPRTAGPSDCVQVRADCLPSDRVLSSSSRVLAESVPVATSCAAGSASALEPGSSYAPPVQAAPATSTESGESNAAVVQVVPVISSESRPPTDSIITDTGDAQQCLRCMADDTGQQCAAHQSPPVHGDCELLLSARKSSIDYFQKVTC